MAMWRGRLRALAVLLPTLALAALGCGGPGVARVSGEVTTAGGGPLDQAWVKFSPLGGGRPSHARTERGGRFSLEYKDRAGALIGRHRVEIGTGGEVDDRGNPLAPAVVRLVTEVEVKGGDNDFRFELPSAVRR